MAPRVAGGYYRVNRKQKVGPSVLLDTSGPTQEVTMTPPAHGNDSGLSLRARKARRDHISSASGAD
jgi:hypothetical protein